MRSLDLYKDRRHSVVKLGDGKDYKIPAEYTVEEVERLLELHAEQERIEAEEVSPASQEDQLKRHNRVIFAQLEVIFQHYQPEMTEADLRKIVTMNEALEMLGFFQKYRAMALRTAVQNQPGDTKPEAKKKAKSSGSQLRDLRRLITFMVVNGFSLLELRKLFLDELYEFYEALFFNLEKMGRVKEGSYDKMMSSNGGAEAESTVNLLRKQMFRSIADRNRKQTKS